MKRINYELYLDDMRALGPNKESPNSSFNNIVFSTEFLLADMILKLHPEFAYKTVRHLQLTDTLDGGYAPKNSHDNIMAKIAACEALDKREWVTRMNWKELIKGKHPRDIILFGFFISKGFTKFLFGLMLWFPMLDIVRAILDSGKVRPSFWESFDIFIFRVKVMLGLLEETKRTESPYSKEDVIVYYQTSKGEMAIRYMLNDGKILNLFRLYTFNRYWYMKPFVYFCKKLYVLKMGKKFQQVLFDRYFRDENHPVQQIYRLLDDKNQTIIG